MTDAKRPTLEHADVVGTPSFAYAHNMARVLAVDGSRVELAFDLDRERWPWLALPAQHPVLLEKYQYFASVTATSVLSAFDPNQRAALTTCAFECAEGDPPPGQATRGSCILRTGDDAGYELALYDADDRPVATYRGRGFVFTDRDFGAWRARSRERALAAGLPPPAVLAAPLDVGLGEGGVSFVSPLVEDGGTPRCHALVTSQRGFHPRHPFHTGSGDHVNVGHLLDCALQASHLALGTRGPLRCVGGAAEFARFVELDVPFELSLVRRGREGELDVLGFELAQLGRACTTMTLRLRS